MVVQGSKFRFRTLVTHQLDFVAVRGHVAVRAIVSRLAVRLLRNVESCTLNRAPRTHWRRDEKNRFMFRRHLEQARG